MNPTPTHNETGWTCYELWQRRHHTASLSSEPNFPLTPRIYIPSGAAVIDFTDIEDAVKVLCAKWFGCLLQSSSSPIAKSPKRFRPGATASGSGRPGDHRIDLHPADRSPDPGLTHGYR